MLCGTQESRITEKAQGKVRQADLGSLLSNPTSAARGAGLVQHACMCACTCVYLHMSACVHVCVHVFRQNQHQVKDERERWLWRLAQSTGDTHTRPRVGALAIHRSLSTFQCGPHGLSTQPSDPTTGGTLGSQSTAGEDPPKKHMWVCTAVWAQ